LRYEHPQDDTVYWNARWNDDPQAISTTSRALNLSNVTPDQLLPAHKATVYLVGAGPGDARLLTLRAAELLGQCDVVLYDALVNPQVLAHANPHATLISVGKHGRGRVWNQGEIHAEILLQAQQGKRIVRLKGGDTSIFARTGEEIEFLQSHGIDFEVVPGVTAASAASAYSGIPLTHRDWSSAVAFITGHHQQTDSEEEADDDLDWDALAKFPGTLVMYMAVTNARRWSGLLMDAGKPASTPVAIVRNASLPVQRTLVTTLGTLADVLDGPPKLRPPIVFIVGPVADLQRHMDWFTKLPLYGRSIMLARPDGQNQALADELTALGASVFVQPGLQITAPDPASQDGQALRASVEQVTDYDWIVFTSANGVRYWIDALLASQRDIRALASCKFAGVGPSVSKALAEYHLACDFHLEEDCNAESLMNALTETLNGKRVLLVSTNRSQMTSELVPPTIARITRVVAYVTEPVERLAPSCEERLRSVDELYVLASSTAIAQAAWQMLQACASSIVWLALSPRIASELRRLGADRIVDIPDLSIDSIRQAILRLPSR
jgi:uroporphyrinogen III methyltransferase/synthase